MGGRTILARDFSIAGMAELLGRCLMRGAHSCVSFCEIFVMTDLIWIGNTLYPRWFVFAVLGLAVLAMIGFGYAFQVSIRYMLQRYYWP